MTTLLFDLDGTLVDSDRDLADAANAAREALGLPPLEVPAVICHVGHGLTHLLSGVIPPERHAELPRAREAFRAYYERHLLDATCPHPGAAALLAGLPPQSAGLVTNKPERFVLPILEGLGWTKVFGVVVCGDTLSERKPSATPVLFALERLGVSASQALFVGDSEVDQAAAQAAGVDFVCVSWGRAANGAPRIVSDLSALLDER